MHGGMNRHGAVCLKRCFLQSIQVLFLSIYICAANDQKSRGLEHKNISDVLRVGFLTRGRKRFYNQDNDVEKDMTFRIWIQKEERLMRAL